MTLKSIWETQGYKDLVERIFDGIRVEFFKGQALITQGSGAYWQLLIPGVGVVQVNLQDQYGTFGVYAVPSEKVPSYIMNSKEPDLANIPGIKPVICKKNNLPNILGREISKFMMAEG